MYGRIDNGVLLILLIRLEITNNFIYDQISQLRVENEMHESNVQFPCIAYNVQAKDLNRFVDLDIHLFS